MAGLPLNLQNAAHGVQRPSASPSGVAASSAPQIFGGLASSLTPEQHRQLQQQALEHAQRIQSGLAQPDALRAANNFGAAPASAAAPQQAALTQQPVPQWKAQAARPVSPVDVLGSVIPGAASGAEQHK